ncbi:MAG: hypothetical protein AMXMBFR76_24830 [Pseudomonadota bacterium]
MQIKQRLGASRHLNEDLPGSTGPGTEHAVVSLLAPLGARWSEAQRIAHLRDLVAAGCYHVNADRMAARFLEREGLAHAGSPWL